MKQQLGQSQPLRDIGGGPARQSASSLWCGAPLQRPRPPQAPGAAAASPATDAPNQPAPRCGWHQPHRHCRTPDSPEHFPATPPEDASPRPPTAPAAVRLPWCDPQSRLKTQCHQRQSRCRSQQKTRINKPISSAFSSPPEASMLVAKSSTSWQATPNNRAIATVLLMMKGVRRRRLIGMRSERWPNQTRVNPINC